MSEIKRKVYAKRKQERRFHIALGVIIALSCVIALIASAELYERINPWTRFNNKEFYVDINSGKVKKEQYFLYMLMNREIYESEVSKILQNNLPDNLKENWVLDGILSNGAQYFSKAPMHGILTQMDILSDLWEREKISKKLRIQTAQQVLLMWNLTGNKDLSGDFISKLSNNLEEEKLQQGGVPFCTIENQAECANVKIYFPNGKKFVELESTDGKNYFIKNTK